MTATHVDAATGNLVAGGREIFPLGLSDPPPFASTAPESGRPAFAELAAAGVTFVRNYTVWREAAAAEQLAAVVQELDAASAHGLQVWLALAGVDDDLSRVALLDRVVDAVKAHPGLGAWKGADEPAHSRLPVPGLVAVYDHVRARDPDHPFAIIEAPRDPPPAPGAPDRPLTVTAVRQYAAACDVHGVDIYPIPPGLHAGGPPTNTDISVVGDVTRILAAATQRRAIWTTLQIAWSGVLPPEHRLVFPTLQQARFMAYDAIVAGARGLFWFGGHLPGAMNARDRALGWNWTYWERVQRTLLEELSGPLHRRALVAPSSPIHVTPDAADVAVTVREDADAVYVVAVRRSANATGLVHFRGLPAGVSAGTVLAHGPGNPAREVSVAGGAFTDPSPYEPHNARVYRFARAG
ncbi:MAG TPA: hypothetical protein VFA05_09370 [Gaiellaceae bacterium]|nr:hypothetical protein [Gaiellaceae bacterium]